MNVTYGADEQGRTLLDEVDTAVARGALHGLTHGLGVEAATGKVIVDVDGSNGVLHGEVDSAIANLVAISSLSKDDLIVEVSSQVIGDDRRGGLATTPACTTICSGIQLVKQLRVGFTANS